MRNKLEQPELFTRHKLELKYRDVRYVETTPSRQYMNI